MLLSPISKNHCLQLCLEEDGCKSVGYSGMNSQTCYMNTKNKKDFGNYFLCGRKKTELWDYYEKIKPNDYFLISSKMNAKVLTASRDFSVVLKTYTGKNNQLWYWDDYTIRSKKYPHAFLQIHVSEYERFGWGKVYISPKRSGNNYLWNFEANQLSFEYKNLKLDIKNNPTYDVAVSPGHGNGIKYQKWSLTLVFHYHKQTLSQSFKS